MSEHEKEERIKNFLMWLSYKLYEEIFIDGEADLNKFYIEALDILYEKGI